MKPGDHLQSATIAGESIFVMNCGSVTPPPSRANIASSGLQVPSSLFFGGQDLKPKTRSPLVHD